MLCPIKATLRIPQKDVGRFFVTERTGNEEVFVLNSLGGNENHSSAARRSSRIRIPVDDESLRHRVRPFIDEFVVLIRVEKYSGERLKRTNLLASLQRRHSGLGSQNNATTVRVGKCRYIFCELALCVVPGERVGLTLGIQVSPLKFTDEFLELTGLGDGSDLGEVQRHRTPAYKILASTPEL